MRGMRERAPGDDDIVVGENEGVLEFAHDLACIFRFRKGAGVEDDINTAIKATLSNKVMISLVIKLDTAEREGVDEVLEESNSFCVFLVNIGITTYKKQCCGIFLSKFIKTDP